MEGGPGSLQSLTTGTGSQVPAPISPGSRKDPARGRGIRLLPGSPAPLCKPGPATSAREETLGQRPAPSRAQPDPGAQGARVRARTRPRGPPEPTHQRTSCQRFSPGARRPAMPRPAARPLHARRGPLGGRKSRCRRPVPRARSRARGAGRGAGPGGWGGRDSAWNPGGAAGGAHPRAAAAPPLERAGAGVGAGAARSCAAAAEATARPLTAQRRGRAGFLWSPARSQVLRVLLRGKPDFLSDEAFLPYDSCSAYLQVVRRKLNHSQDLK